MAASITKESNSMIFCALWKNTTHPIKQKSDQASKSSNQITEIEETEKHVK